MVFDNLYLFFIIGTIDFISNCEARRLKDEGISMSLNGLKIKDDGTYAYENDNKMTVMCRANGGKPNYGPDSSDDTLKIVLSHNLLQNHENTATKNVQDNILDYSYSEEIKPAVELAPKNNGFEISCAWNGGKRVTGLPDQLTEQTTTDIDSTSFAKGIGVGIAIAIAFGFIVWLITVYYHTKHPRPRLDTPLPEPEYYTSVYAWRKPRNHSKRITSPDLPRALQPMQFRPPPLPSQPPPGLTFQNIRLSSRPSQNCNLSTTGAPDVTWVTATRSETPANPLQPLQSPADSPKDLPLHVPANREQPDITQTLQNFRFTLKPPVSPKPIEISRARQLTAPALQMAKIKAVMGMK